MKVRVPLSPNIGLPSRDPLTTPENRSSTSRNTAPSGREGDPRQDAATIMEVGDFLVRSLRLVVFSALVCGGAAFVVTLIRGPVYTAESRFVPQVSGASTSRLAGLAAQFGIDVGAAGGQSPSELYAALTQSREILEAVALSRYSLTSDTSAAGRRASLIELLELQNEDVEQLQLDAVEALRRRVSVSTDVRTGVITLRTTTPWRNVAEGMNARIIALVTDFNQTRRQSQARAEREFLAARSREAQQQLRDAEIRLAGFNDQNRIRSSSQLALEGARLQRAVDLASQVFITLAQSYEQARIEEVRNTPVITVIDSPIGSAKRQRGLLKKTLTGLVLGTFLGLGVALLAEQVRRRRQADPAAFDALVTHLRKTTWLRPTRAGADDGSRK